MSPETPPLLIPGSDVMLYGLDDCSPGLLIGAGELEGFVSERK